MYSTLSLITWPRHRSRIEKVSYSIYQHSAIVKLQREKLYFCQVGFSQINHQSIMWNYCRHVLNTKTVRSIVNHHAAVLPVSPLCVEYSLSSAEYSTPAEFCCPTVRKFTVRAPKQTTHPHPPSEVSLFWSWLSSSRFLSSFVERSSLLSFALISPIRLDKCCCCSSEDKRGLCDCLYTGLL